jgi:NMD protein affecting ribosome stability and mRNA decay
MKCPLCGKEFDRSAALCSKCPFHDKCELMRCPHCGYEFVGESKIVNFFTRIFKSRRRYKCPPNNK